MLRTPLVLLSLSVGLVACNKDASTARSEPGVGESPAVTATPSGGTSGGVAEPSPTPTPEEASTSVVASRTGFYKTASKDSRVADPNGKGQMSNWIALLHRGEAVTVLKTEGDFSEIEVSGGTHGFVPASALLTADSLTPATTQEAIVVFDRPDPVAVSKTRIDPGTLVFILSKKDRFAEANIRGSKTAWVLADQLDTSADEVQIARMIEKARYLLEKEKGAGTQELLEVATATFPSAKLLTGLKALISGPAPTETSTATP